MSFHFMVMCFKVQSLPWKQQLTNQSQLKVTLSADGILNVQVSIFLSFKVNSVLYIDLEVRLCMYFNIRIFPSD